jgi:putative acetyltransferase
MQSRPPAPFIREERADDREAIRTLTARAFEGHPHSDGSEPRIIERLREQGALTLSLVAVTDDGVVGQVAFSPASSSDRLPSWFGLGPLSVSPEIQRHRVSAVRSSRLEWRG